MSDGELQTTSKQPRLGGATGRGWKPGVSGNPRGRPRADFDIARMCREHAPEAVRTLVAALKDPRHKVAAAEALLNRGFGRPPQNLTIDNHSSAIMLHLIAATEVSADVAQELGITRALPETRETVVDGTVVPTE